MGGDGLLCLFGDSLVDELLNFLSLGFERTEFLEGLGQLAHGGKLTGCFALGNSRGSPVGLAFIQ